MQLTLLLAGYATTTDTYEREVADDAPPAKKRKQAPHSPDVWVNKLSDSLKDTGFQGLDVFQDVQQLPKAEDRLEKCCEMLKKFYRQVGNCRKRCLQTVYFYGCWLIFAQRKVQNGKGGSFNKWMDCNTDIKHSQGRAFMKFYRTFERYPKVVHSTLPFKWFCRKMQAIVDHFESHPNVGDQWK